MAGAAAIKKAGRFNEGNCLIIRQHELSLPAFTGRNSNFLDLLAVIAIK